MSNDRVASFSFLGNNHLAGSDVEEDHRNQRYEEDSDDDDDESSVADDDRPLRASSKVAVTPIDDDDDEDEEEPEEKYPTPKPKKKKSSSKGEPSPPPADYHVGEEWTLTRRQGDDGDFIQPGKYKLTSVPPPPKSKKSHKDLIVIPAEGGGYQVYLDPLANKGPSYYATALPLGSTDEEISHWRVEFETQPYSKEVVNRLIHVLLPPKSQSKLPCPQYVTLSMAKTIEQYHGNNFLRTNEKKERWMRAQQGFNGIKNIVDREGVHLIFTPSLFREEETRRQRVDEEKGRPKPPPNAKAPKPPKTPSQLCDEKIAEVSKQFPGHVEFMKTRKRFALGFGNYVKHQYDFTSLAELDAGAKGGWEFMASLMPQEDDRNESPEEWQEIIDKLPYEQAVKLRSVVLGWTMADPDCCSHLAVVYQRKLEEKPITADLDLSRPTKKVKHHNTTGPSSSSSSFFPKQ
jgi:hypothetical protein